MASTGEERAPPSWAAAVPWMAARGLFPADRALDALSEGLGRCYTMLLALDRLHGVMRLANARRLTLLVLGPDAREGSSEQELAACFEPFVSALVDYREEDEVDALVVVLTLVGPNLPHDGSFQRTISAARGGAKAHMHVTCIPLMLHEEEATARVQLTEGEVACAFAFNAGLWGYDSWASSVAALGRMSGRVPLVVTSYNELEADEDAGVLEEMGLDEHSDWSWAPEANPFAATRQWQNSLGRTAADNWWWQCLTPAALAAR
ncbi:hypothetical protein T492DRAFT_1109980 [Pavlovales sp. CCMP2436]|nr:hypothetical protein T492DRAFT_1109980 [Pavlovales sp. CCMP2436]|mmetsp:Transcript_27773/g.63867  ORF Transcript_27773/g.63867 Transcript_27773/m.63867 type:complete len:263 (+) Transcript_27773:40-828(+)